MLDASLIDAADLADRFSGGIRKNIVCANELHDFPRDPTWGPVHFPSQTA
jgi:hypothetical protein